MLVNGKTDSVAAASKDLAAVPAVTGKFCSLPDAYNVRLLAILAMTCGAAPTPRISSIFSPIVLAVKPSEISRPTVLRRRKHSFTA